jgi:hypothetical protein
MSRGPADRRGTTAPGNFMDLLVSGRAFLDDVDDYVSAWHDAPGTSPVASQELYEFLGITHDEYQLWAEKPESLRYITSAHKADLPVADVLLQLTGPGVAARAGDQAEARKLLDWLIQTGRVDPSDIG